MQSIVLGLSDLGVSRLAYGCMRISSGWDRNKIAPKDIQHGISILEQAVDCGYTFFDHADIYGDTTCEIIYGEALKKHPDWKGKFVVATKCGICWEGVPEKRSPYRYDFSYQHIKWSAEQSLRRLGLDTIDLYQLHRPDFLADPSEIARAFTELKAEGKVRYFGVSNFRPSLVLALQKALSFPLLSNQVEIHLNRLDCFTDGTLDQCLELKLSPLAWSPLDRGHLATGFKPDPHAAKEPDRSHLFEVLDAEAAELGADRTTIALAWLLKHPSGIVPIVGSANPQRIREMVKALDIDLSRDAWYRILEAARGGRLP